jgi:hypothetical protein
MLHLGPGGTQVGFDPLGLLLLLTFIALCAGALIALSKKRVKVTASMLAIAAAIAILQLARGTMAPERTWGIILAAIEQSQGKQREQRIQDLQAHWRYSEIPTLSWYLIARRWGMCHHLWAQKDCVTPAGPYQGAGIAREVLDEFVGTPYFPPSRK